MPRRTEMSEGAADIGLPRRKEKEQKLDTVVMFSDACKLGVDSSDTSKQKNEDQKLTSRSFPFLTLIAVSASSMDSLN